MRDLSCDVNCARKAELRNVSGWLKMPDMKLQDMKLTD